MFGDWNAIPVFVRVDPWRVASNARRQANAAGRDVYHPTLRVENQKTSRTQLGPPGLDIESREQPELSKRKPDTNGQRVAGESLKPKAVQIQ